MPLEGYVLEDNFLNHNDNGTTKNFHLVSGIKVTDEDDGQKVVDSISLEDLQGAGGVESGNWAGSGTTYLKYTFSANSNHDQDNKDGLRKDVTFRLQRTYDGTTTEAGSKTIPADASGDALTVTWKNLPSYEDGKAVIYTVTEDPMDGYQTSYGDAVTTEDEKDGNTVVSFTITNTHMLEKNQGPKENTGNKDNSGVKGNPGGRGDVRKSAIKRNTSAETTASVRKTLAPQTSNTDDLKTAVGVLCGSFGLLCLLLFFRRKFSE